MHGAFGTVYNTLVGKSGGKKLCGTRSRKGNVKMDPEGSDVRVLTGLTWCMMRYRDRLLWARQWIFGVFRRWECLDVLTYCQLLSEDCCMKLQLVTTRESRRVCVCVCIGVLTGAAMLELWIRIAWSKSEGFWQWRVSYVELFFWTLPIVWMIITSATFRKLGSASVRAWTPLRLAQSGGPADRLSVVFLRFLPENWRRMQLPRRCSYHNFDGG